MTDIIEGSIYDYPKYYDLLFGSDWEAEFDFLQECFPKHCGRKLKRIFEPACGTGRLLVKLAQAGYEVGGNDLNDKAIDFCNARFKRRSLPETALVGDMADFKVRKKYDAAFNFINTFRHLPTEAMAVAHLQCMANALHVGGVYCLGLHLLPTQGERMEEEAWTARRGNLQINSYMWSKGLDTKARNEPLGITLDIYTPTKHERIVDHMDYRTYTKRQFDALLKKVPELEVEATYDFAYEVSQPITVDASTEDVVYVLKKRKSAV